MDPTTATPPAGITLFQLITLIIAVLGFGLGLFNTYFNWRRERVRIKVKPWREIHVGLDSYVLTNRALKVKPNEVLSACELCDTCNCIVEISNLSSFAVTLDKIYFSHHGSPITTPVDPYSKDEGGQKWPRKLESRTSIKLYIELIDYHEFKKIKCVEVRTQCGKTIKGTSRAFKDMAKRLAWYKETEAQNAVSDAMGETIQLQRERQN